jgi:hypothetical protein
MSDAVQRVVGVIASLWLPFLLVFAIGLLLDRKGMETTSNVAAYLSPLWPLLGGIIGAFAFRREKLRNFIIISDAVLILFFGVLVLFASLRN